MSFRRRRFLQSAGVAATMLAGCTTQTSSRNELEIRISQTERLTGMAGYRANRFTPANVAKNWIESVYGPVIEASEYDDIRVAINKNSVDLQFDQTQMLVRAIEWNEHVDHDQRSADHANLLLDSGPTAGSSGTIGLALIFNNDFTCEDGLDSTNASVVQYGEKLLNAPNEPPDSFEMVKDNELVDENMPEFVGAATAHEVGHNLCAPHNAGNAWIGDDVPDVYGIDAEEEHAYASNMMSFYVARRSGGYNHCGKKIADVATRARRNYKFKYDMSILPDLSPCSVGIMNRSIE